MGKTSCPFLVVQIRLTLRRIGIKHHHSGGTHFRLGQMMFPHSLSDGARAAGKIQRGRELMALSS
jgi:hypothetical protein